MHETLTKAQVERLILLCEELGEATQAACKVLRHGYENGHPESRFRTNKGDLEKELGDVMASIYLLVDARDLDLENIDTCSDEKLDNVNLYLYHQDD